MSHRIRQAQSDDLEKVVFLDEIACQDQKRQARLSRAIAQHRMWVLQRSNHVLGYGVISHEFFGQSFIELIIISQQVRSSGLGPELIRYLEGMARTPKVFTSTNASNAHMRHVLEKLGYEESGIVYNLDPGDPEVVYFKHLAGT
jgi:N-acetylglutamate synthase-like GNAT family acetyltransferase